MRTWIVAIVATVLGIGIGIGVAVARIAMRPWDGKPTGINAGKEATEVVVSGPQPKVGVPTTTYDFGTMDSTAPGRHDFTIRNDGEAVLTLQKGDTTCKCTLANLDKTEVQPGDSAVVTVEWHGKDFTGPYRQTAGVLTNDPNRHRVAFTVTGRITSVLKAVPNELTVSSLTAGTQRDATIQLFCFKAGSFKIAGYEFSDRATSDPFQVQIEPMPAEQLAAEAGTS